MLSRRVICSVGAKAPSVSNGITAIMAKANTREPGVVKTTIGLASNWIVIVAMATEMLLFIPFYTKGAVHPRSTGRVRWRC